MTEIQAVPEELLVVFADWIRIFYQTIIWPVVIIGVIGNFAVVFRICFLDAGKNSTLKPFYRSALLSLALSDLLLLGSSGTNNLGFLGQRTILWCLPEWACTTVPYLQTVAVLVASLTLAGIAIDRYNAIKSKCPLNKGLNWPSAVSFVAGIWIVAGAASYPILGMYTTETLVVVNSTTYYMGALCIPSRAEATTVYTGLFAAIFVPLAAVFIIVHVLLALSIWQRNSPGDNIAQLATSSASQFSNENSTASTSLGKPKVVNAKRTGPVPSHVTRKRRTVRVILVLIIVFGICRLPHWCFLLYKLHLTLSGIKYWHIQIILSSLSLINAAFHPFLYAFLNESLSLIAWFRNWCASKRDNKLVGRQSSNCQPGSTICAKVPRGPYHSP